MTFDDAIPFVLAHEGGFVDHPADPGGATRYGISLRYLAKHTLGDIDGDGDVDIDDIRAMTLDQAKEIYRDDWWLRYGYGEWPSPLLAVKAFDFAINMGARQAHKLLQRAANDLNADDPLRVDGVIGPQSRAAIFRHPGEVVLGAYISQAVRFYDSLIEADPELGAFRRGWRRRAAALPS